MKTLLLIGCGSFVGGVLRHLLGSLINKHIAGALSWGTLCVNFLGCFLLAYLSAKFITHSTLDESWRLSLTVGLCGGFTTFSTFAHENFLHMQEGQWQHAALYISLSLALGVLAVFAGYYFGR